MIQQEELRLHTSSKHKETAISNKRMHKMYVKNLKSQLKDDSVEHFENSSSIFITTGEDIDLSVLQGPPHASEQCNEKCLNSVEKRLVKGVKSVFEPISKSNIKTGNEKKKPRKNITSVLKENKQAFGVTPAKPTDLHEGFSYPILSLPLIIAFCDSSLYQSDKAGFSNYNMKCKCTLIIDIIVDMYITRSVKEGTLRQSSTNPQSRTKYFRQIQKTK